MRLHLFAALSLVAAPLTAQSLRADEVMSTLAVHPLAKIHPVLGSDDRVHLAYELVVTNPSNLFVTLDKVEAIDPAGKVLATMSGDALAKMTTRHSGSNNLWEPGQSGVVFMDVTLAPGEAVPASVAARMTITRQSDAGGKPGPFPAGAPIPASATFTGAAAAVAAAARTIASPLRGGGWVSANGCCDAITSHRGAVIAVNGQQNAPERFAIDWVQIDKAGKMYSGDGAKLSDFAYFGDTVHSVADGVVVNTWNESDEQVPLKPAVGLVPASIGGNMMVVDIGGGAFAFYAHFQRDSLKAKVGDRVTKGQVLGLLGNTGNTDAPHLHFHLMDGPVPLYANGLPFVLERFTSEGVLAASGIDDLFDGKGAVVEPRLKGEKRDRLPLNNEVIDFGQ
jgi:Peptidase family M23